MGSVYSCVFVKRSLDERNIIEYKTCDYCYHCINDKVSYLNGRAFCSKMCKEEFKQKKKTDGKLIIKRGNIF